MTLGHILGLTIDSTVTLGNLLSAGSVLAGIVVAAWKISWQIKEMRFQMDMIWLWYRQEHGLDERGQRRNIQSSKKQTEGEL